LANGNLRTTNKHQRKAVKAVGESREKPSEHMRGNEIGGGVTTTLIECREN